MARKRPKKRGAFCSLIFVLLFCPNVMAAPSLTGKSGSLTHNATNFTVAGSGFGNKSQAAPISFLDFEGGSSGSDVRENGWQLEQGGSSVSPKYTTTHYGYGSLAAHCNPTSAYGTSSMYYLWGSPPNPQRFYITWNQNRHISVPSSGASSKIIRSNQKGGNNDVGFFITTPAGWGGGGFVGLFDTSGTAKPRTYDTGFPSGSWCRIEAYFDMGSQGSADGSWEYWMHSGGQVGSPAASFSGLALLLTSARVNHHNLGESFFSGEYAYIDNVYIDNTRSRVEVGNASTWANCTRREIQYPTSWSDSQIKFTVKRGAFGGSDNAWIYVIDSSGQVNSSGLPVTFGATYNGGGTGSTPPLQPSHVSVILVN
jgi:hypothetical protein